MAPGKTKNATANGTGKKTKAANGAAGANGNATAGAASVTEINPEQFTFATYASGKPDKAIYDREQGQIKAQIDALQSKVSAVKENISLSQDGGANNERRDALRAELDEIRNQQSMSKAERSKVIDQLKSLQDGIQKKIKDLNAAKAKAPFKTVQEVDDRIKYLEKQVDSGNMKIGDEKRALAEISQLKRSRRIVEGFAADQESIEADRAQAEELRKQLDDPEAKAASDRFDAIKTELDVIKAEADELYANRNKLFDERSALQAQLDAFYNIKRESAQRFRDANDRHWTKVNEERARRAERERARRAQEEEAKRQEQIERLREEADIPAFQAQIEDCQTLVDYFSGRNATPSLSSAPAAKADLTGVPKLELRKVEANPGEGLVARKKKGEDDEAYFVAAPRKKGGKKGSAKTGASAEGSGADASGSQTLNVPLPTLSALLSLSIPPPTSTADVSRVIEDLKAKKTWFQENQARVTAENKDNAEARIRQLTGKADSKADVLPSSEELTPPNGGAERPPEPASTPAVVDLPSVAVPSEPVAEKLEDVQENGEAEAADE